MEEARWLGRQLATMNAVDVFPLLDVGSSTEDFRTRQQPWIEKEIFAPLRGRGTIAHLDAKAEQGVDIVADLEDPAVVEDLARRGFKSVFCSNLLEHVNDPSRMAGTLLEIVPEGGYLFLSCPYRYPYHPDPIDNRFRPSPAELAGLFPGTRLLHQAVVKNGRFVDEIRHAPYDFARLLLRFLIPFYRPASWRDTARYLAWRLPWTFRRFEATCIVLARGQGR
ncbi:MAG: hypothetical protein M3077_09325 [Candidatus Dormibacteraeota bacterium]|nr:hypothetical protein [Candidatus Dormibacteraeota bacterium]